MAINNGKAKPMTKDETALLVNLVDKYEVITTKATNAANNKLKDEAWSVLTDEYNAGSTIKRAAAQLRLKWENLKKIARKRAAEMRNERIKTGGGPGKHFPPDETLEKVATMLGTTCLGFTVELGGDAEVLHEIIVPEEVDIDTCVLNEEVASSTASTTANLNKPAGGGYNLSSLKRKKPSRPKNSTAVTKLNEEEQRSRINRNNAVTEYYKLKKLKLDMCSTNI